MQTNNSATDTLISQLNWRYATKKMNGQKVSSDKLNAILEAIRLSASSYGLQPFTVLVIENPELKAKLQPATYGQSQTVDSSHLLVFCGWNKVTAENIADYIADIAAERGVSIDALADFSGYMSGAILGLDAATQKHWADKQTYIALGTGLIAAAAAEVDATPMEGFIPAQVDEILGLEAQGLHSSLILALGYRDASADYLAAAKKVRRPANQFYKFL
jgi:nitroreductase / dihydropteridine reductase